MDRADAIEILENSSGYITSIPIETLIKSARMVEEIVKILENDIGILEKLPHIGCENQARLDTMKFVLEKLTEEK